MDNNSYTLTIQKHNQAKTLEIEIETVNYLTVYDKSTNDVIVEKSADFNEVISKISTWVEGHIISEE